MTARNTNAKTVSLAKASATMGKKLLGKPTAKKPNGKATTAKKPRLSAAEADKITVVKSTNDQRYIAVISAGGEMFTRPVYGDSKVFREQTQINSSFNAAQAWHEKNPATAPKAQLARGIESRQAPHSAKAVRDQTSEKLAKAAKKDAPKAAKNKAPSRGTERLYSIGKTKNEAKEGTWRHHMLTMIQKAKGTEEAKKLHAKSGKFSDNKLDFNWANAQGYIAFAK